MNNRTRYFTWAAALLVFIGSVAVVGLIAFQQGKTNSETRSAIKLADEEALLSLHALKAIQAPTNTESQRFFEGRLNLAVSNLSEACTNRPGLIEPSQHLVLLQIREFLRRGADEQNSAPKLRNRDDLQAKVDEAIRSIESRLMERDTKEAQRQRRQ